MKLKQEIQKQIEIQKLALNGELDTNPLITQIAGFDSTYMFSDSRITNNNGEREFARITKEIEESDYPDNDKVILNCGLSWDGDINEKFHERFPFAKLSKSPTIMGLATGDVEGIMSTVSRVDELMYDLSKVFEFELPPYRDNFIYTRCAPNPRDLDGKLMVNKETQDLILAVESKLEKGDLECFSRFNFHFDERKINHDLSTQLTKFQGGTMTRWGLYMREKSGNRYFNIFLPS